MPSDPKIRRRSSSAQFPGTCRRWARWAASAGSWCQFRPPGHRTKFHPAGPEKPTGPAGGKREAPRRCQCCMSHVPPNSCISSHSMPKPSANAEIQAVECGRGKLDLRRLYIYIYIYQHDSVALVARMTSQVIISHPSSGQFSWAAFSI